MLRDGEWVAPGSEMVLLDCVVHIGHRVHPDRRRLTLASGDLSPKALSPASTSQRSGSRFEVLAVEGDEPEVDVEADCLVLASQVADAALSGAECDEGGQWSTVKSRRRKTKEEIAEVFCADIGYPTMASRFWERGSSSTSSQSRQGRDSPVSSNVQSSGRRSSPERLTIEPPAWPASRGVQIHP